VTSQISGSTEKATSASLQSSQIIIAMMPTSVNYISEYRDDAGR
jgi:hypothetical protein